MRRIFLTLGSTRVRLILGLVLAILLMVQIVAGIDFNRARAMVQQASYDLNGKTANDELRLLAETNHIALLKACLVDCEKSYRRYSCRLERQERLGGVLTPVQVIDVKFRNDPYSVLMLWQEHAPRGDKMLYVEDPATPADQWKMFIHPSGLPGRIFKVVERSPSDPEIRSASQRSIKEFGFANGLRALLGVYEQADCNRQLETKYLGTGMIDGRPTLAIKRILPNGHDYPAYETIIEIDQEYRVPVRVTGTNWQNELMCHYVYKNIRFNDDSGVKDSDFLRKTNNLD
jgi:hypothetical protein